MLKNIKRINTTKVAHAIHLEFRTIRLGRKGSVPVTTGKRLHIVYIKKGMVRAISALREVITVGGGGLGIIFNDVMVVESTIYKDGNGRIVQKTLEFSIREGGNNTDIGKFEVELHGCNSNVATHKSVPIIFKDSVKSEAFVEVVICFGPPVASGSSGDDESVFGDDASSVNGDFTSRGDLTSRSLPGAMSPNVKRLSYKKDDFKRDDLRRGLEELRTARSVEDLRTSRDSSKEDLFADNNTMLHRMKLEQANVEIDNLKCVVKDNESRSIMMESELKMTGDRLTEAQFENVNLARQNSVLRRQLVESESNVMALTDSLHLSKRHNDSDSKALIEYKSNNDNLIRQLSLERERNNNDSNLKSSQIAQLSTENANLKKSIVDSGSRPTKELSSGSNSQLEVELRNMTLAFENCDKKCKELEICRTELMNELQAQQEKFIALEAQNATATKLLESQLSDAAAKINCLQIEIDMERKLASMETEKYLQQIEKEKDAANNSAVELQSLKINMSHSESSMQGHVQEMADLRRKNRELEETVQRLTAAQSGKTQASNVDELGRPNGEFVPQDRDDNLKILREEVVALSQALSASQASVEAAATQLVSKQSKIDELQSKQDTNRQRLHSLGRDNEAALHDLDTKLRLELKKLEDEQVEAGNETGRLAAECGEFSSTIKALNESLIQCKSNLKDLELELASKNSRITGLEEELVTKRSEAAGLADKTVHLENSVANLHAFLTTEKENCESLRTAHDANVLAYSEQTRQVQTLRLAVNAARDENESLLSQVQALKSANTELEVLVSNLAAESELRKDEKCVVHDKNKSREGNILHGREYSSRRGSLSQDSFELFCSPLSGSSKSEMDALGAEISILEERNAQLEREIIETRSRCKTLEAEVMNQFTNLSMVATERAAERAESASKLRVASKMLKAAEATNATSLIEVNKARERIAFLEVDLARSYSDLHERDARIASLLSEHSRGQQTISRLAAELELMNYAIDLFQSSQRKECGLDSGNVGHDAGDVDELRRQLGVLQMALTDAQDTVLLLQLDADRQCGVMEGTGLPNGPRDDSLGEERASDDRTTTISQRLLPAEKCLTDTFEDVAEDGSDEDDILWRSRYDAIQACEESVSPLQPHRSIHFDDFADTFVVDPVDELFDDLVNISGNSDSGQKCGVDLQEALKTASNFQSLLDEERARTNALKSILMKFTRQFSAQDNECLLDAGVILVAAYL
jgi:hypothetical protein